MFLGMLLIWFFSFAFAIIGDNESKSYFQPRPQIQQQQQQQRQPKQPKQPTNTVFPLLQGPVQDEATVCGMQRVLPFEQIRSNCGKGDRFSSTWSLYRYNTIQYNSVQIVQHSTVQYSAVQYSAVLCSTVQ